MAFKKEIHGVVISKSGDKSVRILVERKVLHPKYRKIVKRFSKHLVHDEKNQTKVGDSIVAIECRPLSKRKFFRLKSITSVGVE